MKLLTLALTMLCIATPSFASDFPAREVYQKYSPAVVVILASGEDGKGMIGTGSIIAKDGLIITNAHVVFNKEQKALYPKVGVYLKGEKLTGSAREDMKKRYDVDVLNYDTKLDLAVLRIKELDRKVEAIALADPRDVGIGEEVIAIGHPEQGGLWTLTYGRISAEMKDFQGVQGKDVYQTDASVNRGNSGGPLLDNKGRMVAVNSNIARVSGDGLSITGINFAIKSSVVQKWLKKDGVALAYGVRPTNEAAIKVTTASRKGEETKKPGEAQDSEKKFTTPKRPYDLDDVLKAAEKDLDEIMDDMRAKKQN